MGHRDDIGNVKPGQGSEESLDLGDETPGAESMEQYVQLHEHIERLRADRRPLPPTLHSDEDARPYGMAALFRAAAPGAASLDPAFAQSLRGRIRGQTPDPAMIPDKANEIPVANPAPDSVARRSTAKRKGVSRRGLLQAGLGAAAAAAAGIAVGVALDHEQRATPSTRADIPLVEEGTGVWVAVAQEDAVPIGGVMRFNTDYIVGFVRHSAAGFTALSGVCTHMGCILQWNGGARTFDCPCHGGRFTENGDTASMSPVAYRPLPSLKTKVEDGQVWVYVVPPISPSTSPKPSATGGYQSRQDPSGQ